MKNSLMLSALSLLLCAACQQTHSVDGCYLGVISQDSVFLNIASEGGQVSGNLHYKFLEKHMNTGTVAGQLMGDSLLLLDYNFQSEGVQSVRQVAFLLKDGKLAEGYGDMEDGAGGMKFKDTKQLNYGNGFVLSPVECTTGL